VEHVVGTPAAPAHRWLVLIAMTGSLSMIMVDQTVVTVALPEMARDLGLSSAGQQWVVNAYVLALAALVAAGGRWGDRWGPVTTYRAGVVTFFTGSVLCGLAPRGELGEAWIIASRVVQGAGAALMTPVSAALVIGAFTLAERGRAMAVYAGIAQVFLAVGPLLGGALTQLVSWRAVFWINVPVGLAALVLVAVARPPNVRSAARDLDVVSLVLLVCGLSAVVLGLQQLAVWGLPVCATVTVLGAGALVVFVRRQLRSAEPLVDVRLFGRRPFLADAIVLGLVQFALVPMVLLTALYLQNLLGFDPVSAGVAVLPVVLPLTLAAQFGGRWFDRAGVRSPVLTGLVVAAVGAAAWTTSLPALAFAAQLPGMVLTGLGLGLTISPTNTDGLNRVAAAERGQASGLLQTVRQLGGTVGVAVVSAVVLGLVHPGSPDVDRHAAADAVAAGFAVAGAAFVVALVVALRLLPAGRQQADAGRAEPPSPTVSDNV
jgi:EmrB/QacA subfamily drug resistance transporter